MIRAGGTAGRRVLSVLAGGVLSLSLSVGSPVAPSRASTAAIPDLGSGSASAAASKLGPVGIEPVLGALVVNPPGTTERASVSTAGAEGAAASGGSTNALPSANPDQAISADGRWVAFVSTPGNVSNEAGATPVFLRDRRTGVTSALPWVNAQPFPNGVGVAEVSISATGDVVAFTVYDALANPPSAITYLVVWRRVDGKSVFLTRGQLAVTGRQPSVSGDGRFVAYTSVPVPSATPTPTPADTTPPALAWNVTPEATSCPDGTVSFSVNASDGSGVSNARLYFWPPGGSAWQSQAMTQSPGTTIWSTDLHYPNAGTSSWAGQTFYYYVTATDTRGNYSKLPASGYNTMAVLGTCSILLGPPTVIYASARMGPPHDPPVRGAPGAPTQVVVFDLQTGGQRIVSHDPAGNAGDLSSSKPSISADGAFVAFASDASLVPDDANNRTDIYRWDAVQDSVARISVAANAGDPNESSSSPSMSGDGNAVAFASNATNISADRGLTGGTSQVFLWRPSSPAITLVSVGPGGPGSARSYNPSISSDGRVVAFDSDAANLVAGDTNGTVDVFLRNHAGGVTIRASVDNVGQQVSGDSQRPSLSGNGAAVAFDSISTSLVRSDRNGELDVFVRELGASLLVTPASIDFGTIGLGTSSLPSSVVATNDGWLLVQMQSSSIGGANPDDFAASDGCSGLTLDVGQTCSIGVIFLPQAEGPRTAVLDIAHTAPATPRQVDLLGGAGVLRLELSPQLGPPGIVTTATGTGFPPGASVDLRWDRGLNAGPGAVVVGPDGTFTAHVLVFHNDVVGLRTLVASPPAGGVPFTSISAPFLVVQGPLQPPAVGAIRYLSPDIELIVIRR